MKLNKEAKVFYEKLKNGYGINDPAGLTILQQAAEALMRLRQAQEVIKKEGLTVKDRFDQLKNHPATVIEKDSRNALLKALDHLDLELPDID